MRSRLVIGLAVALVVALLSTAVLGRIALMQWRNASAMATCRESGTQQYGPPGAAPGHACRASP
ncbi:hypothetical protein [Ectopseudomonas mendocina]|uniref:hypothetical protein n=1 Tax=Ectopseudomonas mendocina TaxID=300 RepID=UPI0005A1A62D|nr:hypothetical protein [Pseudomonas mendocina]